MKLKPFSYCWFWVDSCTHYFISLPSADKIYHVTIMPCYDKKLEASRDDFMNDILQTRDVDCVLTSSEVLDLIHAKKIDFFNLAESPIDKLYGLFNFIYCVFVAAG